MKRLMLLAAGTLGGLFWAAPAAAQTGGQIQVWGTPSQSNNGADSIVITGAIGDAGKGYGARSSGAVSHNSNANYRLLKLKKGSILLNATQINQELNNAQPNLNTTTCSANFSTTAPVPIVKGTKAYANISGTLNVTITFAFVGVPKGGKCTMNSPTLGQYGSITGTGSVQFG